jgi:phenylpropionate dioxygenase-like ring-hydroxylating dioxygenase large terminal subunit
MLSNEDNELATNTNRGTPMGELFRRFWLPVALSEELPGPDCAPIRVQVLGEKLVAIRDTAGRPGLFDAFCPHRGAPLFFGRNEENGLRCVYHGWKFDVDGTCVDLPSAQEGDSFKAKVHIKAYPCVEAGDLIWAYMGPAEKQPPFPEFPWTKLPKSHRYVTKFIEQCNYLQAMEGDYDPSHAPFLHSTFMPSAIAWNAPQGTVYRSPASRGMGSSRADEPFPRAVGDRRVTEERTKRVVSQLDDENSAMLSIQVQDQPDGKVQASVGVTWWMPLFCTAGNALPGHLSSNMRIPIDNESLMFYRLRWSWTPITDAEVAEYKYGGWTHPEIIPGTWRTKANIDNDYNIDRVAQKNFSYTGIKTFPLQDIAVIEAQWGPIADRTQEHLTSTDYAIIKVRRRLLKAAKDLAAGIEPTEPWHPETYRMHREVAVADTAEEAIELAKVKASTDLLAERAPELAAPLPLARSV